MLCKIGFKTPSLNGRARERKGLNGATITTPTVTIQWVKHEPSTDDDDNNKGKIF